MPPELQGAALPIIRHLVQLVAGVVFTRGALHEDMLTAISGLILSVIAFAWMLVARRKPALSDSN